MKSLNAILVLAALAMSCFSCKKDLQDSNVGQTKVIQHEPLFVKNNNTISAELFAMCEYFGTIKRFTVQVGFAEDLSDAISVTATKIDDGYVATFPVQTDTVYYYRYVVHRYSTEFDQITEWEDEQIYRLSVPDVQFPTVSTSDVSFVSTTSAMGCGSVVNDGVDIVERGFCWSTHSNPKIYENCENRVIGNGELFVQMSGLSSGTTYYARAYAKSSTGIAYSGNEVCFKTKSDDDWEVETLNPTEMTESSATLRIQIKKNFLGLYYGAGTPHYGFFFGISPRTNNSIQQAFSGNLVGHESVTKEYNQKLLDYSTTYYYRTYIVSHDTIYGELKSFTTLASSEPSIGELSGTFSVSPTQQVEFSPGNLQYQAATNKWRFARQQWDYVGENNESISDTYYGWIDLFGWGTSGHNHGAVCYQPWSSSSPYSYYYAYGSAIYNLNDQTGLADWGSNTIYLGNNATEGWRTLTSGEWYYLFNSRITQSGMRYAKAQLNIVNDTNSTPVNGIIIFPDDWIDNGLIYCSNTPETSYTSNIIFVSDWKEEYEPKGTVFLPAAGRRRGLNYYKDNQQRGFYWSASKYDDSWTYLLYFYEDGIGACSVDFRNWGQNVRLVRDSN